MTIIPDGVICRIRLFPVSATNKVPELLIAMPVGLLNDAPVPTPSALPADGMNRNELPANVETTPGTIQNKIMQRKYILT